MMFIRHIKRSTIDTPTATIKQPDIISQPKPDVNISLSVSKGKYDRQKIYNSTTNTYLTEDTKYLSDGSDLNSSVESLASTKLPSISNKSKLSGSSWSTSTVPKYMKKASNQKKSSACSAYYNQGFNMNRKNKKSIQKLPMGLNTHGNHKFVHVKSKTPNR